MLKADTLFISFKSIFLICNISRRNVRWLKVGTILKKKFKHIKHCLRRQWKIEKDEN